MKHLIFSFGLCVSVLYGCGSSSDSSAGGPDRNCSDFSTQEAAQDYFDSRGGSPTNNVDGLDRDHDGIACESLPSGGTTSGGGTGNGNNGGNTNAPIIGSWVLGSGNNVSVITFITDTHYLISEQDINSSNTFGGGMEYGTYSWNPSTGELFSKSIIVETNASSGLYDPALFQQHILNCSIDSSILSCFKPSEGTFTFTRLESITDPLIGGWVSGNGNEIFVVSFVDSSHYLIAEYNINSTNTSIGGMEYGTYSWDSSTGSFEVLGVVVETNSTSGFYNPSDPSDQLNETITVKGNAMFFSDQDEGITLLTRVK